MFFKRIEMHGFKSFADPVLVEFDKGITCVVGPNGSGKSNISDAIRWVLGEQSPKMLRGGKMEDVIFSGTQNRKSRGMAEVTLVIDNSKGSLPIDYSEVAITRRMYRSGESEYAINNNQCRMRDIRELLSDTGIGVDGYSLIGQGKISEIISNKKESIREIFEESAGIVSYRNKKAESERKLEQTKNNMDRANDIILEIESRIDALKVDSERAKEYLQLKDRFKELEVNLITSNLSSMEENIKVFIEDSESLQRKIATINAKREKVEKELEENRVTLEKLKEGSREKEEELLKLNDLINQKTSENSVSRERINGIENNRLRLKREITQLNDKIQEENRKISLYKNSNEENRAKLKEKEDYLAELQRSLDIEKSKTNEIVEKSRDKENLLALLKKQKEGLELETEGLKKHKLNSENDVSLNDSTDLEEKLLNAKKQRDEIENELVAIDKNIKDISQRLIGKTEEQRSIEKNREELESKLRDHHLSLSKDESRMKTLAEMEVSYEGYQHSVKYLMSKNLEGVLGVVADIIKVDEGLEVAIETALGVSVQNIVVDNEQTAKKAIELLKKNRAGRGTFLPLNKIKSKNYNRQNMEGQGIYGYGDKIATFEKKYENIVSFLLGNTIIVEDMNTALDVSNKEKGVKVVTKAGDVIFATGAMSGGSPKNKIGNLFERKKEIENLSKRIVFEKNEISKEETSIKKLINERKILGSEILKLQEEVNKFKYDEREAIERRMHLLDDINGIEREAEKRRLEAENKKILAQKIEGDLEDRIRRLNQIDTEVTCLNEELIIFVEEREEALKIFGEKESAFFEKKLELTRLYQEMENHENILNMYFQNCESLKEEISFKENQILNIEADFSAISEGINNRSEEIGRLTIEKNKLQDLKREKEIAFESADRNFKILISKKDEALNELTMIQQQKYEIDIKLAKYQSQEKALKDRLWEELEISFAEAMAMPKLEISQSALVRENREIKNKIKSLGDINIGAIKEYDEISERYSFLTKEREDIQTSLDQLNEIISSMDKEIKKKFKESFDSISLNFEEIFREFFGGGSGKIEIDNIEDPLNANIDIVAQPPGKQLRNINLLSGGEKTMTAIALMFAVLKTKPTPCCILDEVEAALDDNNIHIFGNYLKRFEDIQFTLITHQKATMEHADVMYGVTMPERGISKVYSLKMGDEIAI